MNFMFEWQEQYFTSELSEWVRYCYDNIKFISSGYHVIFFYYIDTLMTAFLMIFRRFPKTFQRFPKILQNLSEGHTNVPCIFRKFLKISEDFRRLPKMAEDF